MTENNKEQFVQPSTKTRPPEDLEKKREMLNDPNKKRAFITVQNRGKTKKEDYYVDSAKFDAAIKRFYAVEDSDQPNMNYIGECFLKIAQGLARSSSFSRYSYKDEMISSALIKCMTALRGKKWSVNYGSKAFSFWTQICYWSFCAIIKNEKKHAEKVKKYREVKYPELIQCADAPIYVRPEEDSED